ncbi:MAG: hypothetical protein HZB29_00270 [Nitrospinae bacterium]|nr:hypothetical protein [Nitrospinota bacterium]
MDNKLSNRRQWFRDGVNFLGRAVMEFNDAAKDTVEVTDDLPRHNPLDPARGFLRPPGAIAETEFVVRCDKCGDCVKACPEGVLFAATAQSGAMEGYPVFDPARKACFLCSPLHCVNACKAGALNPVADISELAMGKARMNPAKCKASEGDECRLCHDFCPLSGRAVILLGGRAAIQASECVGCGQCEYHCLHNAGRGAITTLPRISGMAV